MDQFKYVQLPDSVANATKAACNTTRVRKIISKLLIFEILPFLYTELWQLKKGGMARLRIFINIIEFSIIKKDAKIITRNFPILAFELDT